MFTLWNWSGPANEDQTRGLRKELYSIDHSGDAYSGYIDRLGKGRTQRQRGVELVRIPFCAWCDNATDGLYNGQVLEIRLQNVTKKDGGLSKSRLDMQWKTKYKPTAPLRRTTRTSTKGQEQVQKNEHEPEVRANLLARAGVLGVGEDGNADGMSDYSSPAESISPIPAPMYVSVLDAIGEPSFQASRMKPLPSWMTLLPSNRQSTLEQDDIATSFPEDRISVHGLPSAERAPEIHTPLETTGTISDLHSHKGMKRFGNSAPNTAVGLKRVDATMCEPAILEDTEDGIPDDNNSLHSRETRPQRSGTPYSSSRAVYRTTIRQFPCQEAATNMPARQTHVSGGFFPALSSQVATLLLSRDGKLKKRDVSREEEPIVERFKRQKTEGAILSSGEKNETCKDAIRMSLSMLIEEMN